MSRRGIGRACAVFLILCVTALGSFWPIAYSSPAYNPIAPLNPTWDLLQPSTDQLQGAFSLVGDGSLPAGYPQPKPEALVPVTLLKAIAWTESAWRQFSQPGATLVSSDGGYGLMQITSGMTTGGLPDVTQSAIAHNFLYNLGFGAQDLADKFEHTPNIGNDDPSVLEHWYYALWAYNSWGWANNPNNPIFTRDGTPATNAAAFPYQERVLYWVAHPPTDVAGRPLWPAIPVTLPPANDIGLNPGPLPEVQTPHRDVTMPAQALNLSGPNGASFVYDISIPDGTVVAPGAHLTKTWLLRNKGPRSWGLGYNWAPVSGAALSVEPAAVPLTPPLADVAVTANLVAPRIPGVYREYWQMRGPDGRYFGVRAWVDIEVSDLLAPRPPAIRTPPNPAPGAGGSLTQAGLVQSGEPTPVVVPASELRTQPASVSAVNGDDALYAGDVSVPDGTVFSPGQHFVKTWRIRNTGTHSWGPGYRWHFEAGSQLSGLDSVPVNPTTAGATVQISVAMTAPSQTGVYTSFWQMTDTSGLIFGHQAWVSIVVKNGGATRLPASPTSNKPPATLRPTAVPRPTATAIPPTDTPQPQITATVVAVLPTSTVVALPTLSLPGGDGRITASPWTGSLAYRVYYAGGTTAHGMQESIVLYYPGAEAAHVEVNLYRPDGAHRSLSFSMRAGGRQVLALNRIAPNTDLAVEILSDRRVVTTRVLAGQHSILSDPAAARTARAWWFPAAGTLAPSAEQSLVFFNPHDEAAAVTIEVGKPGGGCCLKPIRLTVPPLAQYTYQFSQDSYSGPLTLLSSSVVAVERQIVQAGFSGFTAIPGSVVTARHWYFPEIDAGTRGTAAMLFNPGTVPVQVVLHLVGRTGAAAQIKGVVAPFSQLTLPLAGVVTGETLGGEVDADGLITAALSADNVPALYLGSTAVGQSWLLVSSTVGKSSSQSVSVYNPNNNPCTVSIRLAGPSGGASLQITIAAHGRVSQVIDGLVQGEGSLISVQSSAPVAVTRTLTNTDGTAVSVGLQASASDG